MTATTNAGRHVDRAARSPWVLRAARAGLVAKGVLYAVVALLALGIAFGRGQQEASQQGAMEAVAGQPFGRVLLGALAVGLGGYALWRLAQAWLDPRPEGGAKGAIVRFSYVVRAFVYGGLCALAVRLLLGAGASGERQQQSLTRQLMETSWGPWLVGALGAILLGVGVYQLARARPSHNEEELRVGSMSRRERRWAGRAGVAGHLARAVVFGLSGLFLVRVALRVSSERAVGLDAALRELADAPYGKALLAVTALGLLTYALWCWVLARFGKLRRAR